MPEYIAIKRLTASDCTFFEAGFRRGQAGNQKSINLNADVLVGKFYPALPAAAAATDNQIPVTLSIYGPNSKSLHPITRKIIKSAGSKNWRLNGETVHGPTEDPSRYDDIKPDDLAVMLFKGDAIPTAILMIIVSQSIDKNATVGQLLSGLVGNKSMAAVTAKQISNIIDNAGIPENDPLRLAGSNPTFDAALEDAALGGLTGIEQLLQNRGARKISRVDFDKAKLKAQQIGMEGEALVNAYLSNKYAAVSDYGFKWTSLENAVSPFDFEILLAGTVTLLVDVKSTTGPFENIFHISLAEIIEAAGDIPYRIYRVSEMSDEGANLRISEPIGSFAKAIKSIHETQMPDGIKVDSFSLSTKMLVWSEVIQLDRMDGNEPE